MFKENMIIRLPKPIELLHDWVLENFKYQDPCFYARLFDDSEEGPFEVPPGRKKVFVIIKPLPGDPKLYILKGIKSARVLC